jgi:hypothetical protein
VLGCFGVRVHEVHAFSFSLHSFSFVILSLLLV